MIKKKLDLKKGHLALLIFYLLEVLNDIKTFKIDINILFYHFCVTLIWYLRAIS